MKSITEFSQPTLQKFLAAKATLTAEGKTAEEITTAIGESFKLEGDKLKFIFAAADLVVEQKAFRRVLVASIAEGEAAPAKYTKVEDNYYLVETMDMFKPMAAAAAPAGKGFGRGGGQRGGGKASGAPKSSPWGASPEEIAAKKKASTLAAQAKKA
jgi:hypothetical protein